MFNKNVGVLGFDVVKEGNGNVMRINYEGSSFAPSMEGSDLCMSDTVEKLIQNPAVNRVILVQRRHYHYDEDQVEILKEIANIYNHLIKQKKVLYLSEGLYGRTNMVQHIVLNLLKGDPIGAYVELKRAIREERIRLGKLENVERNEELYMSLLSYIFSLLDKTKLIELARPYLEGHSIGNRGVYRGIFKPFITPDFMFTRLMAEQPLEGDQLDFYKVGKDNEVTIFKIPGDIKYLYHLNPPEFRLDEEKYELLDLAKNVLSRHEPKAEEFTNPERMRQTFFNIGRDLIMELAEHKGIDVDYNEVEELAKILVRYTVGFGLVEVLLQDEKIQDITINGPIGQTKIFIVHSDFEDCVTNIIPSVEDGESWATKFRLISGRPLDEANPVLDTELSIPGARARAAIITNPLNPLGFGYAIRRHRDKPWTLPLFIHNKMINPTAAGLMSFIIDGARTMIIAGTRSSGKTSFLSSCMVEIMRKFRVITCEDTLELPVDSLRKLGYNIQPMKVRSAISSGGAEMSAEEGIRTSLRMGDSSLIVGEVRSSEALALYEAMRIGALANVVAGTIHGDSPYGVFDRVVNDLKVPRTSFKATDIIVIANPVRSADGLHRVRRVMSITEVRKEWEDDPLREKGFVDLMKYDTKKDELVVTEDLKNGDSEVVKKIAGSVREWAGNWDAVWDNIMLRAKMKKELVAKAVKSRRLNLLEADFVIQANDMFHMISDSVKEEVGSLDNKRIFFEWDEWLKKEIKKRAMK